MLPRRCSFGFIVLLLAALSACQYTQPAGNLASHDQAAPKPSASSTSTAGAARPTARLNTPTQAPPGPEALPTQAPIDVSGLADAAGPSVPATLPLNPLTGLPASDPTLLLRRPLAIKISNYPRDIRPQYGLNEADVVFEYYIEWGYTRFIGIFYGNDATQIGPVRSGRYFDEHITRMYHAYYVFNYADPREYTYFLGGDLQGFMVVPGYGQCPPFFQHRVSSIIADVRHYETYFDSTRFAECLARKAGDNSAQELMPTFFRAAAPQAGTPVQRIFTYYSRCDYNYWEYDEAAARYVRFQEAGPGTEPTQINSCVDQPPKYAPLIDSVHRDRVVADNVVVLFVPHTFANANEQDDEIYHINLIDQGRAYVFRDGLGLPARWVRPDIDQPLAITTVSGNPLGLRPGRTFFEVVGETSSEWSDGADWHFDFHTP